MISLFDIYGLWFPMVWLEGFRQRFRRWGSEPGGCLVRQNPNDSAVHSRHRIYVRFLVGLYKECKPRSVSYWVRRRLGSGESAIAEPPQLENTSDSGRVRMG